MKNYDIVAIMAAYANLKDTTTLKLPASVSWKRRLNLKKLSEAKATIDEAIREIQERYSDDEHSTEITTKDGEKARGIKKEYMDAYAKEQMEVLDQDTEVAISKIKIGELDGVELTDADMDTIYFMIEEEE